MNQEQYTMKDFLEAVEALFHSNDPSIRNKSNKFICEFDKRPEAWDVAMQVLSTDNLKEEAYFNAIQMLKTKIKYDFSNYLDNKEIIVNTLSFLIDKIDKFKKTRHYIMINFCKCFALAMVFSGDSFSACLKMCVDKLNDQSNIENLLSLLMIFNFLAEANADRQIVIDETSKSIFTQNLDNIEIDVLTYINFIIKKVINNESNNSIQGFDQIKLLFSNNVLEAFTNWISFGLKDETLVKLDKDFIDIINFVFSIEQKNMPKHAECICMLLQLPLEIEEMRSLGKLIYSKILPYKDLLYQTSFDSLNNEESGFFIDVFCTLCQNNFDQIFYEKRFDLLQIIVDLTKNSDNGKIDTICDFWIALLQFFYSQKITTSEILANFKSMFVQLILNMIKLMQFDPDLFKELNIKKTKSFRNNDDYCSVKNYRASIKEFFCDFMRDFSFDFIYTEIIFPQVSKTVEEIKSKPNDMHYWSRFEVLLYTFYCACMEISKDSDLTFLNTLFDTIFEIPKEFIQITRTVTDILDAMTKQLSKNPALVFKAFNYLIDRLENPLVQRCCSVSSKSLLVHNKSILAQKKQDLVNLYNTKIREQVLLNEKYIAIQEGIIEVVCYSSAENYNKETIRQNLVEMMKTWIAYLNEVEKKITTQNPANLSSQEIDIIGKLTGVLKSFARGFYEGLDSINISIMGEIFKEIWPKLKIIINAFSTNVDIIENIIQFTKHFMRGMKDDFKVYLEDYIKCLIEGYKISPISSYLYGFEVLVTVFYKDSSVRTIINNLFNEFCQITFDNYLTSLTDVKVGSELGEDFFGMINRLIKLSPFVLLDSPQFEKIIKLCVDSIGIKEMEIEKTILVFLHKILNYKNSGILTDAPPDVAEIYQRNIVLLVEKYSDEIVKRVLTDIYSVPPAVIIDFLKDLIFKFIELSSDSAIKGFSKHLAALPSDCLTKKEKEQFLDCVRNFKEDKMDSIIDKLISRCQNKHIRDQPLSTVV